MRTVWIWPVSAIATFPHQASSCLALDLKEKMYISSCTEHLEATSGFLDLISVSIVSWGKGYLKKSKRDQPAGEAFRTQYDFIKLILYGCNL